MCIHNNAHFPWRSPPDRKSVSTLNHNPCPCPLAVCIKSGELELALDVYTQMRAEGVTPNLVTFNTLIDVYGKTGQWEEAVRVLDTLEQQVYSQSAGLCCHARGQLVCRAVQGARFAIVYVFSRHLQTCFAATRPWVRMECSHAVSHSWQSIGCHGVT